MEPLSITALVVAVAGVLSSLASLLSTWFKAKRDKTSVTVRVGDVELKISPEDEKSVLELLEALEETKHDK